MDWLTKNWRWAALNTAALMIMTSVLWRAAIIVQAQQNLDPALVVSGKWAIRFLLLSLSMTPLNTLFGWRSAIKLRKPAGLWAFGFGAAHFLMNIVGTKDWLHYPIPDMLAGLGVIGLSILALMAATSTRWAQRHMGKWWKRLHRLVYAAGLIVIAHALLEFPSKRVAPYDPQANIELTLYLAILTVLLAVRIPAIRAALVNLRHRQRAGRGIAA
jgi:DMSO/TMAO reductase YedYZ heme-binding membrane subunit